MKVVNHRRSGLHLKDAECCLQAVSFSCYLSNHSRVNSFLPTGSRSPPESRQQEHLGLLLTQGQLQRFQAKKRGDVGVRLGEEDSDWERRT